MGPGGGLLSLQEISGDSLKSRASSWQHRHHPGNEVFEPQRGIWWRSKTSAGLSEARALVMSVGGIIQASGSDRLSGTWAVEGSPDDPF